MAESVLMGAGIGAGTSMLAGKDPLKGAMMGGAMGGIGGAMGGASAGAGAGAGAGSTAGQVVSQGPAHLGNVATSQAFTPGILTQGANATNTGLLSSLGDVGDMFKSGQGLLQDTFGISPEQQNMEMLKLGIDKMTPEQQQQIQHANLPQIAGNPTAIKGQVNTVGPIDQQTANGGAQTFGLGPQEEIEQRSMYQNPAWGRRIGG